MTMEIVDSNFDEIIKKGVVMVDFWAPWCGPCRMLSPVIDEISEEMKDLINNSKYRWAFEYK